MGSQLTVAAVRAVGKPLSTVPRKGKDVRALFEEGFDAIPEGSEIYYFRVAAAKLVEEWRAMGGDR